MTLIEPELRAALRAEASAHRPDREAMLDRITRTAMHNRVAGRPRVKIAGAAVAVAAVLGGGGFAQWAVAGDGDPVPGPTPSVTVTAAPTPSGVASSSAIGPTTNPSSVPGRTPKSRQPGRSPSPSATAGSVPPAKSTLSADGSVAPDGDSQASSVVTVTTAERLTAFEVTIRIAKTDGFAARGGSQQVPGASVTSTVTEESGTVVYRFVLSSGDTLEPGTYTFYARYTHATGGRDANGDSYAATATTGANVAENVSGDFR